MKKIIGSMFLAGFFLSVVCSAQVVKVADLSIKAMGETEVIALKKNGQLTVYNKRIGELKFDGSIRDLSGKILAVIDKAGRVTDGDKKPLGVVDKNGDISFGSGQKTGWTKDGKFAVSDKEFLTISPNKKKLYQTASLLIFLNFLAKAAGVSTSQTQGDNLPK